MTPQRIDAPPTHAQRIATVYELVDLGETHLIALGRAGLSEEQWDKHLAATWQREKNKRLKGVVTCAVPQP